MTRLTAAIVFAIAAVLTSTPARAQSSSPPGPYVIDIRGVMVGAPTGPSFYYAVPTGTFVPSRAFGFGGGIHVYPFHLGAARIGIGVDGLRTRGTAATPAAASTTTTTTTTSSTEKAASLADASMQISSVAGQVSFNFGSRDGWSYLTAGYGSARTRSEVSNDVPGPIEHSIVVRTRRMPALNFGGGARWFIKEHIGVGFDVRFHRLMSANGLPSKQVVGLSVGMSVR